MAEQIALAPSATLPLIQQKRPRIGSPLVVAILLVLYGALALSLPLLAGGVQICNNDLGGVFLPSARIAVASHPLDIYTVRIGYNPAYPNATGPLGELAIAAALGSGRLLGLQNLQPQCTVPDFYPLAQDSIPLRMWMTLLFALLPLGMAYELLRLSDKWRAKPLTGWRRALVWGLIVLSPPLWDSLVFYGHLEQALEIWLALLAVRQFTERRLVLSGILLGMALLCRTAGIFVAIPLIVLLLMQRRWLASLKFGLATGATVGLGLLPFLLHAPADVLYSLSSFRALLPIGDGSFWTFVRGTPWEQMLQSWDSTFAIALAILFSVLLIWVGRVQDDDPALYAVICASTICFSIGIKAIWGYYFAEPLIWGLAWTLASTKVRQPWWEIPLIPLFCFLVLFLTEWRLSIVGDHNGNELGDVRVQVLLMSGLTFLALMFFNIQLTVWLALRSFRPLPRRYRAKLDRPEIQNYTMPTS